MKRHIHVLTDGLGDSGYRLCQAVMKQFPETEYSVKVHRFVRSEEAVDRAFETMEEDTIIIATLLGKNVRRYCNEKAEGCFECIDLTGYLTDRLSDDLDILPVDASDPYFRAKDEHYFDRIKAIEFAVRYDDGKDPRGIPKADVVLIGVSRTSKTPTSMYLANYNLKVANLPLVLEIPLPKEIFEKDKNRIFGLVIQPNSLNNIRRERLREMGLDTSNSNYADMSRIQNELEYARKIMDQIGCYVIDVSDKNIEETAVLIMDRLDHNFGIK